jgi:hypothetical protein
MTAVATLVLIGTPATSVWPLQGLPAAGGALFSPTPQAHGSAVAQCGGMSPTLNACATTLDEEACRLRACWPTVKGGLAYTGSITTTVLGKDRYGVERYVYYRCSYIASSSTQVGGVVNGGCQGGSNAPYECNRNPTTGAMECGNYLWPPFRVVGSATPPIGGTAPLGAWTAAVERDS